ncbi:hypothetical protein CBL_11899 [Carabus blaptoides fortunei]
MRMMRYDYEITYVPGKDLTVADALSRQPLPECSTKELEEEMTAHIQCVIKGLPATDIRLQQIRESQAQDETCANLTKYAQSEWPEKKQIHHNPTNGNTITESKTPRPESITAKGEEQDPNRNHDFDQRHGPGDRVWITNKRANGVIQSEATTPRSYWVKTQTGVVRRNRQHLIHNTGSQSPEEEEQTEQDTPAGQQHQTDADIHSETSTDIPTMRAPPRTSETGSYQTRSGMYVKTPDRMNL